MVGGLLSLLKVVSAVKFYRHEIVLKPLCSFNSTWLSISEKDVLPNT